ncbi:DUF721 domain-containing protein [Neisseriaceae bacterium TC5R-5]|nr:DUF721 domain-containing protein [Neisseriaceae bacterium TC5R-5]
MSERHFSDIANSDHLLKQLSAQAHQLLALDKAFQALLPDTLNHACQAVRIREGELVVYAHNGIVAARLRMMAHGLLPSLARQGYIASKVRIKVDLQLATKAPPPKNLHISTQALDAMEQAAQSISQPLVSAALAKLIARQRGG